MSNPSLDPSVSFFSKKHTIHQIIYETECSWILCHEPMTLLYTIFMSSNSHTCRLRGDSSVVRNTFCSYRAAGLCGYCTHDT